MDCHDRSPKSILRIQQFCLKQSCWSWHPPGCSLIDCGRRAEVTDARIRRGDCPLGKWSNQGVTK